MMCSAEAVTLGRRKHYSLHAIDTRPGRPTRIRTEPGVMSTLAPLAGFGRWVVGEVPWSTRQSLTVRVGARGEYAPEHTLAASLQRQPAGPGLAASCDAGGNRIARIR
jgi:hypothetical protein